MIAWGGTFPGGDPSALPPLCITPCTHIPSFCKRDLTKTPLLLTCWHKLQNPIVVKMSIANSDNYSDMSFEFKNIDEDLLLRGEDLQNFSVTFAPNPSAGTASTTQPTLVLA